MRTTLPDVIGDTKTDGDSFAIKAQSVKRKAQN